jgi:hypothetical protein
VTARVNVYVYYRVADPASAATRECAEALVGEVRAATGVAGRLLRRSDDPGTWMEVYEDVASAAELESALERAVAATGFVRHVAAGSRRIVERFEAL